MTCAKLFSNANQAAQYSLSRPNYPESLYEVILNACAGNRALAVDIGTGSGQAAVALAEHFEHVVAQDGSAEQLKHAAHRPNIQYQEADAHSTGLPAGCADLVTVAQALHWFDHPRFYREVRRILRPTTGVLAAWTYPLPVLNSPDHPAQKLLLHLYEDVLGPWWDARRRLVDEAYRGIEPSIGSEFDTVTRHQLQFIKTQTLDQVLGWLHSWSAYHTYLKEQPDKPDPLVQFRQDLLKACGEQATGKTEVTFTLPFHLIVAKGPKAIAE